MLQVVEHRSPALRDLALQPWGFEAESIGEDTDPDSFPQRQSQIISQFAVLRCIRFLDVGIASLYPQSLLVLSHLPDLEELHASVGDPPPLTYDIPLSSNTFPSLRKIVMERVVCGSWLMDLWSLAPVFKNLKLISIDIWSEWIKKPGIDEHWADNFLLRVCKNSPKLVELDISFSSEDDPSPRAFLSRDVEEPLRQLPLENLELDAARFEGGCEFLSSA